MDLLARSCLGWFVYMLKALFWHVDLSAAPTMYDFMASCDLKLNSSRHVAHVDLSAAPTMYYFDKKEWKVLSVMWVSSGETRVNQSNGRLWTTVRGQELMECSDLQEGAALRDHTSLVHTYRLSQGQGESRGCRESTRRRRQHNKAIKISQGSTIRGSNNSCFHY